jgi:hypothetical protein
MQIYSDHYLIRKRRKRNTDGEKVRETTERQQYQEVIDTDTLNFRTKSKKYRKVDREAETFKTKRQKD